MSGHLLSPFGCLIKDKFVLVFSYPYLTSGTMEVVFVGCMGQVDIYLSLSDSCGARGFLC